MRERMMRSCKTIAAGLLTTAMVVTGIFAMPAKADAVAPVGDQVVYDNTFNMADYWKETKTAPVKAGYVFGGWYLEDGETHTPLTEETAEENKDKAVAKFVPAHVLSIKAQNEAGTKQGDGKKASIRIISSVDEKDYKEVGMEVRLGNGNKVNLVSAAKVYTGLIVTDEDGAEQVKEAKDIFGAPARYLSVWNITNISDANDSRIIYVRPHWTTMDGTRVEGLARYVHVEDGYLNYISVPVNLMTGDGIAAGTLQVTCNDDRVELLEEGTVETGRLLTEMEYNRVDAKTVRIVGNGADVGKAVNADGIYANVRFLLKEGAEITKENPLILTVTGEDFCDWEENTVVIDAWDVRY